MKIFSKILIVLMLTIPIPISNAQPQILPSIGMTLLNKTIELGFDTLKAYFSSNVSTQEQEQLEERLRNIEDEVEQLRQAGYNSNELDKTETLISSLNPTIESLDTRVSSLEDRVSLLEQRINVSQSYLPNLRQETNYNNNYIFNNVQPSFDCRKASVAIEFSICNSPELRDIDGRLGAIYWDLRNSLSAQASNELKQEQLKWLEIRDSRCHPSEIGCLLNVYSQRINELSLRITELN